jgi:hypothetical protein
LEDPEYNLYQETKFASIDIRMKQHRQDTVEPPAASKGKVEQDYLGTEKPADHQVALNILDTTLVKVINKINIFCTSKQNYNTGQTS